MFFFILFYSLDHPLFGFFAGAHMNPAVTLAFAVVRRFPWRKVPVYWTAQMLGAFAASACAYAVYYGEGTVLVRALSGKCKGFKCFACKMLFFISNLYQ